MDIGHSFEEKDALRISFMSVGSATSKTTLGNARLGIWGLCFLCFSCVAGALRSAPWPLRPTLTRPQPIFLPDPPPPPAQVAHLA